MDVADTCTATSGCFQATSFADLSVPRVDGSGHTSTETGQIKERQFSEGWVKFQDNKVERSCRLVNESVQSQRIGGKKEYQVPTEIQMALLDRTNSYSGIWCTAGHIAYENASCAEKLRNEISKEKRENQAFIRNMERCTMMQNIQKNKAGGTGGGKARDKGRSQVAETICAEISDKQGHTST